MVLFCIRVLLAAFFLIVGSYSSLHAAPGGNSESFVAVRGWPNIIDDMDQSSLRKAIAGSIRYLRRSPKGQEYDLCGDRYTAGDIADSLEQFLQLLNKQGKSVKAFDNALQKEFAICQAAGALSENRMLATGYYEPVFNGSLEKKPPFTHPLYRRPSNLVVFPSLEPGGKSTIGRISNGRLVPYWTRGEIESGGLLDGQELVYLADPLEAFIMQVQGSGKVRLPDGSIRRVQFAAKNGRPYRSIGRLLVDQGKMRLEEVDLPKILAYLRNHPDESTSVLHHNESYIFFRWGENIDDGPLGSMGEPLVSGRSVALDQRVFPPGVLCFLETRKPSVGADGRINGWEPMRRFVLNQDSGSAIEGPGRVDFFWGDGPYAEAAAGGMKQPAKLFFLIRKK